MTLVRLHRVAWDQATFQSINIFVDQLRVECDTESVVIRSLDDVRKNDGLPNVASGNSLLAFIFWITRWKRLYCLDTEMLRSGAAN